MLTIWDPADRAAILKRLERLRPADQPRWGKFTPGRMVEHVMLPMMGAMGEVAVEPKNSLLGFFPLNWLVIHWMPWPKGVPTAPEFLVPEQGDFPERLLEALQTIERFSSRGADFSFRPHPAFGNISGESWGVLTWRHLDHHLRQFGL